MTRRGIPLVSDEQILEDYKSGKFILQIVHTRHVGIARVRNVIDRAGLQRHGEAVV